MRQYAADLIRVVTDFAKDDECVAVCCIVLQCLAVCYRVLQSVAECCSVLPCVAVCCRVLQCTVVLKCAVACHNMLLCVADLIRVVANFLQKMIRMLPTSLKSLSECVAVCCSALQYVAICWQCFAVQTLSEWSPTSFKR